MLRTNLLLALFNFIVLLLCYSIDSTLGAAFAGLGLVVSVTGAVLAWRSR